MSRLLTDLKVATTFEDGVEQIIEIANKVNVEIFQGSTDDVLGRFYGAAEGVNPDYVVRFTSDCPLIDPAVIDAVIDLAISKDVDYVSNTLQPTFPDGLDVEVFRFSALCEAFQKAKLKSEREHVTPYIWKNSTFTGGSYFTSDCFMFPQDFSQYRITVDTEDDFNVVDGLITELGTECSWVEYIELLKRNIKMLNANKQYTRNEGYQKSIDEDNI